MELEARVETRYAGEYLAGLVELWAHTYPVRHDVLTAEVILPRAQLVMTSDEDSLSLRLVGDTIDEANAARATVERHLFRVQEARGNDERAVIAWREI